MNVLATVIGLLSLGATIVPAVLFAFGGIAEAPMKAIMLVGTVTWFLSAPFWLKESD